MRLADREIMTVATRSVGRWWFLARDSMLSALYAIARPSVRLSVCLSVRPSVTRVDQSKTVEARIMQFSPTVAQFLQFLHGKFHPEIRTGSPRAGASNKGGHVASCEQFNTWRLHSLLARRRCHRATRRISLIILLNSLDLRICYIILQ